MTFSVDTIIDAAQLRYQDLSDTNALRGLNTTRNYVMTLLDLRQTSFDINLTAGTSEYALNEYLFMVDAVQYVRSSTRSDYKVLRATSTEELDATQQDWRKLDNGEPSQFYLNAISTGPVIGVTCPPDTTTSGGYPILRVYGNQGSALAAAGTFYDDLPNDKLYVYGIRKEWAEDNDRDNVGMWDDLFQRELARVQGYLFKKNQQLSTRMQPSYMTRRAGVI